MRTLGLISALASLAVLQASALHAAEAPAALRDRLVAITQAWVDAIPLGKQDVWQHTLADDAVLVDEFGRIQHKKDAVASLRPFPAGFSGSIELRDPHAQQYGDTALLRVEEYERETVFGQKFVVRYQSLLTFVKQDSTWKLAGYEDVTIPTPPPKLVVNGLVLAEYAGNYRYGPDRAWSVSVKDGALGYVTKAGRPFNRMEPIARDVFMGTDDERNLLIFRRDAAGHVTGLIERRKFNDLHLARGTGAG
ncbi:nuclear transport factor 2 family protein [Rhodanobacter koreensis]